MKQIERDGSPQRRICALLDRLGRQTVKQLAALRGMDPRATARQLDILVENGYVRRRGRPAMYERTEKCLPTVVPRKPKSEAIAIARQRDADALRKPFIKPGQHALDRVFSTWRA